MEGEIYETGILDYALFHTSTTQNCYEGLACSEGKIEAVASGHLDKLALYLSEAKGCQSNQSDASFKLQLDEKRKGFPWFTKDTLARFLHLVNMPEALKVAIAIEGEITQLDETKKFHISLYAKNRNQSAGATADISCLKDIGTNQQIKVETASSDDTKNELLRALDLRIVALGEELASSFNRAAGATCSTQEISDLLAFTEHFGALDLRHFLLKILARRPKNQPTDSLVAKHESSRDMRNNDDSQPREISHQSPQTVSKPVKNVVSPAKIAQVERQSSSESDETSALSDEDQSRTERSRSLVRSATPRRSASPMRRVQIGRSGSRRSTALTIKSLNYFPPRERSLLISDADGSNSGDEEESNQPPKKPENPVRRMSVQDAISLFENKQKDQNSDAQKRRGVGEISASITAKSVLRRWSAGMSDSLTHVSHENASDATPQDSMEEIKPTPVKVDSSSTDDSPRVVRSSEVEKSILPPIESHAEPAVPKVEEVKDRATTSAEWCRQKEAELNQMLMKMKESGKPGRPQGTGSGEGLQQDVAGEQRGGFYSQYGEKKHEKLGAEHSGKQAVKEAEFKIMKESRGQSKAKMTPKTARCITGKGDSPIHSQRLPRNTSPPVLPKKELPKPTAMRKASLSKASTLPATRKSWPAGALPRTSGTATPKTLSGSVSTTSNTTNRRAPISTPTIQPRPKAERFQQIKKKGTPPDVQPSSKVQEAKKQRSVLSANKSVKPKTPSTTVDESTVLSAKPSFYNKVTRKSSVVPLESKPILKKGTGLGPARGSPIAARPKVSSPDDSSKNSGSHIEPVENEPIAVAAEPTTKILEANVVEQADNDANVEASQLDNDLNHDNSKEWDQGKDESDKSFKNSVKLPGQEIQVVEDDKRISSPAWVEVNHQEGFASCNVDLPSLTMSPELVSAAASSSPRVHHSLSQMLLADNNEPEIIEWGNAENPPALVYQKDAPKGFKRLLKFARKSKGEGNVAGWVSPSVFSEGEDETEASKAASKRSSDALIRKSALQAKGYEPPNSVVSESFDGGNSSERSMDSQGMNDTLPVQSSSAAATVLDRLREGQNSSSATSTKATRSFFSLSTFRSNKSSDAKLR